VSRTDAVDPVTAALFPLRIENGGANELLASLPPYALCAQAEPRALVDANAAFEHAVTNVDLKAVEALVESLPDGIEAIVGLGGGQAMDNAKFLAWRTGLPLYQLPTILSVDAPFTEEIGVRAAGRVRYVGSVRPTQVVVDPAIVRQAPPSLNRAGVAEIISCHTATWDWTYARERGLGKPWDERYAELGRELLAELTLAAPDVRAVSDEGVRFLASALQRIGAGCTAAGHPSFQEGCEHAFAYVFEWLTGEHRVHGELVACGAAGLSVVQGNEPERVRAWAEASGCRFHAADLGIDRALCDRILRELASYAEAESFYPTVIDTTTFDEATCDAVWRAIA
jgi:glycerol-1-phosphate dehydrogenase [NAD(P)+]